MDTPIFEENDLDDFKGIDIMRAVRSFDPCLPCGVHMYLGKGKVLKKLHSPTAGRRPRAGLLTATRRRIDGTSQDLRAIGDRIERLLDELRAAADPRAYDRPRSCCGWSPSSTAPGSPACVELVGGADGAGVRRPCSLDDELVASLLVVHGLHPDALGDAGRARARHGAAVPRRARRRRRAARRRRGRRRGAPPTARQLRRVPVVGGHAAARGRAGDRRGRPGDRHRSTSRSRRPTRRPVTADARAARPASRRHRYDSGGPSDVAPTSERVSRRVTDPLAVLSASGVAAPRRSRARASAARCAPSRSPTSTTTSSTSSAAQPHVHLPRLLPAVHARRRRRRPLPRRARPLPRVRRLRALAGAVGRAPDPGERGVLLPQLDARIASPRSTPARPARPSRCCRSTRGTSSSAGEPGAGDAASPTSRRSSCARTARPRRDRSASSCRSTPATSWSASCAGSGGASTAAREAHDALDAFFAGVRPSAAPMEAGRERAVVRGRRAPGRAYAAVPTLMLRLRITEADGRAGPRRRARGARSGSSRSATLRRRRGGPARRAVRRDAAVGRHAAAVPVDPRRHDGPGVHRRDRDRPPVPCTYDFEVAAQPSTSTPRRRRDPARAAVRGTVFTRATTGFASSRSRGTRRRVPAAGRCGAT